MVRKGLVYTISVYFYAFRLAFSSILHCVLHHFTLHLAANSPKSGADGGAFKYKFIWSYSQTNPFLHQNKPSRESIFCGKVGDWWIKKAFIVLNFLPNSLHQLMYHRVNRLIKRQVDK